ncbi:response regulator [Deinococcus radiopugnans]|uniref:DNA-binding NarL/FixJ family response regulator n=1 Tax=Deinococcus radiopugnans ATCC 19172 TaxID=585398 RepID=A0A5C4Y5P6_9DEIO|nr:response regulator transcription factor [Deinococcus radiopugnans]MBB6017168.1 DNA-binding NarL/FixJ family response regulator [Deinococcus radiopugnans ATCC 19172]TNM70611.1 response regulator transcription factor [Deinococcus radiopugnans ATCC 19172]
MSDPAPPHPGVTPLRVLIVDDQPLVRQGLASLLDLEDDVQVLAQAENGRQALHLADELRPDVVLMDVRMPVMDGIQATAEFRRRNGPPVVLLTTFEEVEDMTGGLNAGAAGYLFKSAEIDEILEALWRVHRGEKVIHPRVAQALAQQLRVPARLEPSGLLTEREVQVIRALAAGQPNKRIGQQMGISEGTVKVHVSNILAKLGAGNRTEAVRRAMELGLLRDETGG